MKLAKPRWHIMSNKINCKQKILKNLKEKDKKTVQIDKFQFKEGSANETIGSKRMLEKDMPEYGEYLYCDKRLRKKLIRSS